MNLAKSINWIDINLPFSSQYDDDFNTLDSFCERDLNNPGTLIKLEDGTIFLIGHINSYSGVCDCCTELDDDTIIAQYAIIINF